MSASGQGSRRRSRWAPAATTMWTWCPSSSWQMATLSRSAPLETMRASACSTSVWPASKYVGRHLGRLTRRSTPSEQLTLRTLQPFVFVSGPICKLQDDLSTKCSAAADQVLIKTDVTKYLEFKAVDGSFVLNGPRIEKVPITGMEAFRSPLMGLFEKRRAAKFFRCANRLAWLKLTGTPRVALLYNSGRCLYSHLSTVAG